MPGWAGKRRGNKGGDASCFLKGTRIRTPRGEVEVEALSTGDLVETVSGEAKPITWIGRWKFERRAEERWPGGVPPVRVARSALGPQTPHSDLFISEAHAVYLDGLLIPARQLINGRSIVRCSSLDARFIEYFHVELAAHDVIFAEGAPTETFRGVSLHEFEDGTADEEAAAELFAPLIPYSNRAIVRSRLRTALSPWVDRRQPGDIVWERLADRAETELAA